MHDPLTGREIRLYIVLKDCYARICVGMNSRGYTHTKKPKATLINLRPISVVFGICLFHYANVSTSLTFVLKWN
jgi:hypothetical protein